MHMVEIIYLTRLIIFLPFSCVVTRIYAILTGSFVDENVN